MTGCFGNNFLGQGPSPIFRSSSSSTMLFSHPPHQTPQNTYTQCPEPSTTSLPNSSKRSFPLAPSTTAYRHSAPARSGIDEGSTPAQLSSHQAGQNQASECCGIESTDLGRGNASYSMAARRQREGTGQRMGAARDEKLHLVATCALNFWKNGRWRMIISLCMASLSSIFRNPESLHNRSSVASTFFFGLNWVIQVHRPPSSKLMEISSWHRLSHQEHLTRDLDVIHWADPPAWTTPTLTSLGSSPKSSRITRRKEQFRPPDSRKRRMPSRRAHLWLR